ACVAALPGPAATQVIPAAAPAVAEPGYADLVDLVLAAPVIADATIVSTARIKGAEAASVAPGLTRFYVEADVAALLRGKGGVPPRVGYLLDVAPDPDGRLPRLKKARVLLFARMVPQAADQEGGQLQLVAGDAQLPWTPDTDARVRAIAAAVVAAVVIFFVARSGHEARPTQLADAGRTPVATPPPPPPPAQQPAAARMADPSPVQAKAAAIDVEIRVSPETATVSIDGKDVDGNPYSSQYPSDDVVHHIRASAPGYIAKSRAVVFNANVTLDLALERNQVSANQPAPAPPPAPVLRTPPRPQKPQTPARVETARAAEPAPAPVTTVAQPATPAARPSSDIDPNGGNKPRRPIELNNPYGGAP
ncbi:MAG TPA: hypothetical protein VGC42_25720, partial [Kofleriaceae bacterium]